MESDRTVDPGRSGSNFLKSRVLSNLPQCGNLEARQVAEIPVFAELGAGIDDANSVFQD
jgi:hypothetical protein